jgi:energy-coupling factor transporter transmembrane protein EcfT
MRRNPIHTLKLPAKAIMHTSFLLLVISEPSPLTLMITGAISLASLTIFLHHKLG